MGKSCSSAMKLIVARFLNEATVRLPLDEPV